MRLGSLNRRLNNEHAYKADRMFWSRFGEEPHDCGVCNGTIKLSRSEQMIYSSMVKPITFEAKKVKKTRVLSINPSRDYKEYLDKAKEIQRDMLGNPIDRPNRVKHRIYEMHKT